MKVVDNLYWLNGGSSNAFLYQDDDGFALFDSGMPKRNDPVAYLKKLGHGPQSLKHIFVTHADIDHIGNVERIRQATGAVVYASAESAELISQGKYPSHNAPIMSWVLDKFTKYEPTPKQQIQVVADGDRLPILGGLDVIATPGHTSDHISFHSVAAGVVFAGDAVFARGRKLTASPKLISADYELAKHSAVKLAKLTPVLFACGHGDPFIHEYEDLMMLFADARVEE